jgi:hypothetical protein
MEDHSKKNESVMKEMVGLAKNYAKWIDDEMKKSKTEMVVSNIGKPDPKRHLSQVGFNFYV